MFAVDRLRSHRVLFLGCLVSSFIAVWGGVALADTTAPAKVAGLTAALSTTDVGLSWNPVTLDAIGGSETIDHYNVYRGASPDFPLDFVLAGSSPTPTFDDIGAGTDGVDYYYLITAVDDFGNESGARETIFHDPAVLSGFWTTNTIELSWTHAEPQGSVTGYRIYFGEKKRQYDSFVDVGLTTAHSLNTLLPDTNYYITVVPLDAQGNTGPFSNEHIDALAGTIDLRVHDEARLCFGTGNCPAQPDQIQRNSGREMMIEVDLPEGDWVNITATYTVDSRLCSPPTVPDKCTNGNPNPGGWNPCGDPWDRTASLFLVLNDCISQGGNCYGSNGNLELIHAVTPFGTDAPPPDGDGLVGPASWTFDLTPYRSVLQGTKHVGTFIGVWVADGWYVTVDFHFSEDPAETSPRPPADGVAALWFRDGSNSATPNPITIPVTATSVMGRVFTTGHGGVQTVDCVCGPGSPCDEFCTKAVSVKVDNVTRWNAAPHRTDCTTGGPLQCGPGTCSDWNACGCPSCTFDRSGWCPGFVSCHTNEPCDQDVPADTWFTPGTPHDVRMDVRNMTPGASWANSLAVYWYE